MIKLMLTTIDNEFDPFTQFDDWLGRDNALGYNTTGVLAAEAHTSSDMSEIDYIEEVNRAVREIARLNVTGLYKIVEKEVEV